MTFRNPLIVSLAKSMMFARVNADNDTAAAKRYGVSGFPTMVITKPNGIEIDRLVGYYPPEEFLPALVDLLSNRNTLDDLRTKALAHPDSLQLLYDLAESYSGRSDMSWAVYYYNLILEKDPMNKAGKSDDAWFALAGLKRKDGKVAEAVQMYAAMAQKFPKSDMIESSRLMIPYSYQKSGDLKKALKEYEQFIKDFPKSEDLEWVNGQIKKIKEGKKK